MTTTATVSKTPLNDRIFAARAISELEKMAAQYAERAVILQASADLWRSRKVA